MTTNERANSPNPTNAHEEQKMDMKSKLSTLWIFVALNYLYCDIVSLMDPELLPQYLRGNVNGLELTPGFLLGAAILVEIFIAMVLLSRVLPYRANRWANISAGTILTAVQSATLFVGVPAPYYLFFSVIEIATTVVIVWFAWTWRAPAVQVEDKTDVNERREESIESIERPDQAQPRGAAPDNRERRTNDEEPTEDGRHCRAVRGSCIHSGNAGFSPRSGVAG